MTFPVIAGSPIATSIATAAHAFAITLPGPIAAGNLLLILLRLADAQTEVVSTPVTFPAGWTLLFHTVPVGEWDDASDDIMAMAWRKADGSEGATATVTCPGSSRRCAAISWRITGAADPTVQPPDVSPRPLILTPSATPTPNPCTPTGGAKDYLWLWIGGWEGEQTSPPAGTPSGYAGAVGADTGVLGPTSSNCRVATASRTYNTASESAGAWTISVADDWMAAVVAVHPSSPTEELSVGPSAGSHALPRRQWTH